MFVTKKKVQIYHVNQQTRNKRRQTVGLFLSRISTADSSQKIEKSGYWSYAIAGYLRFRNQTVLSLLD